MRTDMSYKEMAAMMGMDDTATFGKVMLDQLELEADSDHTLLSWDGQAWYGSDYNKVWLKSEGTPNAVSYTHLDVYKRQAYAGASRYSPIWTRRRHAGADASYCAR